MLYVSINKVYKFENKLNSSIIKIIVWRCEKNNNADDSNLRTADTFSLHAKYELQMNTKGFQLQPFART